jgi:Tol biopolymer transport system component
LIGRTERLSLTSNGTQLVGNSYAPSISVDGRYIAFVSDASNLVPDNSGFAHVFVHDRQTRKTELVDVDNHGRPGNGTSNLPSISADGRYVAFVSFANNLVAADTNNFEDVFVYDRGAKQMLRVSVASDGTQANGVSTRPRVSADGHWVAFQSGARNLVGDESSPSHGVFVHNPQTHTTTVVSIGPDGSPVSGSSPSISADGRYIAFESSVTLTAPGSPISSTNSYSNVFVYDQQSRRTFVVSADRDGAPGNNHSFHPSLSADGQCVAFASFANNLTPADTNRDADVFVRCDFLSR